MEGFTIRKLATELDVKPMTIYHHVPNKEAIIDGMVDLVFAEIDLPPTDTDWKAASPSGPDRHGPCSPDTPGPRTDGVPEPIPGRPRLHTTTRCSAASARPASRSR